MKPLSKIKELHQMESELVKDKIFINHADPKKDQAPDESGLYLLGNTLFNPFTSHRYYLVKTGLSRTNLSKRIKGYKTANPMIFHIDYLIVEENITEMEAECHALLAKVCEAKPADADEWYIVSRKVYLQICKEGFGYFFK